MPNNAPSDIALTQWTIDWTRLVGSNGREFGRALTTGADGSIYIAGSTNGDLDGQKNSGYFDDAFLSKFNPDGTKHWTRLFGSSNELDSIKARAVTTGADGSIYIAGEKYSESVPYEVAFLSKFNPDGTQNWIRLLGASEINIAYALTTGADGSIYIAGSTSSDSSDAFLSKFNPDGTEDWAKLLGDKAWALTTGADGSIYIAGSTSDDLDGQINSWGSNAFISQFNPDGTKGWTKLLPYFSPSTGNILTTGANGSIYIAGSTTSVYLESLRQRQYWGDHYGQIHHGDTDAFITKFVGDFNSINENINAESVIATLATSDQDISDTHTYELVTGNGDIDNSFFTIDGNQLKINSSPNYEAKSTYSIRLKTTDNSGLSFEEVFTLSVNDLDETLGTSSNDLFFNIPKKDDYFDGLGGIDTVKYERDLSYYSFDRTSESLQIKSPIKYDYLLPSLGGTDTLKNIEYLQFTDQSVEESKVDVIKTYSGEFSDYKFYKKSNGIYQIKTDSGYDDITGLPLLTFTGEAATSSFRDISAIVDIKGTFDQVTGLNTNDAKMFRLYNASFKRLPDPDGLKYWIGKYSSGENDSRAVASSFLVSDEFKERYGANVSDTTYVNNLYQNVLGRLPDSSGLNYWLGQLNRGAETRYEVLLGFAESAENKALFTEITGFG